MAARVLSPGDVIEIPTRYGLGYVAFVREVGREGDLVRVLPPLLHQERPAGPWQDAFDRGFWAFFSAQHLARSGDAAVVGHVDDVPAGMPLLRYWNQLGGVRCGCRPPQRRPARAPRRRRALAARCPPSRDRDAASSTGRRRRCHDRPLTGT